MQRERDSVSYRVPNLQSYDIISIRVFIKYIIYPNIYLFIIKNNFIS